MPLSRSPPRAGPREASDPKHTHGPPSVASCQTTKSARRPYAASARSSNGRNGAQASGRLHAVVRSRSVEMPAAPLRRQTERIIALSLRQTPRAAVAADAPLCGGACAEVPHRTLRWGTRSREQAPTEDRPSSTRAPRRRLGRRRRGRGARQGQGLAVLAVGRADGPNIRGRRGAVPVVWGTHEARRARAGPQERRAVSARTRRAARATGSRSGQGPSLLQDPSHPPTHCRRYRCRVSRRRDGQGMGASATSRSAAISPH
jgi:hypothetical protein